MAFFENEEEEEEDMEEVEGVEDAGLGEEGVMPVAAATEQGLAVEPATIDHDTQPQQDDDDVDEDVAVVDDDEM